MVAVAQLECVYDDVKCIRGWFYFLPCTWDRSNEGPKGRGRPVYQNSTQFWSIFMWEDSEFESRLKHTASNPSDSINLAFPSHEKQEKQTTTNKCSVWLRLKNRFATSPQKAHPWRRLCSNLFASCHPPKCRSSSTASQSPARFIGPFRRPTRCCSSSVVELQHLLSMLWAWLCCARPPIPATWTLNLERNTTANFALAFMFHCLVVNKKVQSTHNYSYNLKSLGRPGRAGISTSSGGRRCDDSRFIVGSTTAHIQERNREHPVWM